MANRNQSDFGLGTHGRWRAADARARAAEQRDAALERVGSTRRWVITAAAGLSAGFAALVYALAPGHSLSTARAAAPQTSSTPSSSPTHRGQPAMPAPASGAALGLGGSQGSSDDSSGSSAPAPAPAAPSSSPAPAASAPAPAPAPAPVTSGGS